MVTVSPSLYFSLSLSDFLFRAHSVLCWYGHVVYQHDQNGEVGFQEDGDTRGGARMLSDTKIAILSSACIFLKNAYEWVYFIKIAVDVLFYWLRS